MFGFASPARFKRFARPAIPVAGTGAAVLFVVGLYLALVASPADYDQGDAVRIMYVHVPAAWLALFVYATMALASVGVLVWRHPLAALFTRAAAPLGAGFTALCLASGSLWGAPMWGTWWVWDARLTSVLVLFFLYVGYIALVQAFEDTERGHSAGAVLVLVGSVNLPIIKFSVDWWNTLHQSASVLRLSGPTIHASMLAPLLIMAAAFTLLFAALALVRTLSHLDRQRLRARQLRRARGRPVAARAVPADRGGGA